ncbi:hydroxymyristoyl-ACP dehydratase [Dyella choica]|uniref:Hydroxymyristoyl-ACP dehydratase n=1 Tax=Dyella choica TaxID=1927959 RepID=A0A432M798_9GAMM|nr:hydroxymyristoyl-ACP dehydratase [Dyella choica]
MSYRTTLCIAPEHPCLAGHFPGHPLVPGVVLLERVAQALREWRQQRLAGVREAKFLAPLNPGEAADLELTERSGQLRFELRRAGQVLARGVIEGAA